MDQLKLLMDYTKFHIGVYLTLFSASLALVKLNIVSLSDWYPSFIALALAGAAGGVIGSSIPEFESFSDFKEKRLGFWFIPIAKYKFWAWLEHAAFWTSISWAGYVLLGK